MLQSGKIPCIAFIFDWLVFNFMEIITSRANPVIKAAAALKEASARRSAGMFLLEGARLCCDAALNNTEIVQFFVTEKAAEKYRKEFSVLADKAEKGWFIAESVAEKLSDTKNSQDFFAVCRENKIPPVIKEDGMYIFTDNIQNPDNLGAIVRTAEALGADGLIVSSGCDIYSPKAQRASMGALLRFPVIKTSDGSAVLTRCKSKGMKVFASVVTSDALRCTEGDKSGGCVLVIGNEGNGVSDEIISLADERVTIPMKGKAESLNASAAASILIWEFLKDR